MLNRFLARCLGALRGLAREPLLWTFLAVLLVGASLVILLLLYAVERHDAFLRLKPLLCEDGISDRGFFMVALAAPLWLLFTLNVLGELWQQVERRRAGRPVAWLHLAWFFLLASGLGALVLAGLRC